MPISSARATRRSWSGAARMKRCAEPGRAHRRAGRPRATPLRAVERHGAHRAGKPSPRPADIRGLEGVDHLLVEGGAETAAAFLRADLVDRLLLYRAPILIGAGKSALGDIGLTDLAAAHDRWTLPMHARLAATGSRSTSAPHEEKGNLRRLMLFTGIVSDIGTIEAAEQQGDLRVRVATAYETDASISAPRSPARACA
jgi:hypothetical protein